MNFPSFFNNFKSQEIDSENGSFRGKSIEKLAKKIQFFDRFGGFFFHLELIVFRSKNLQNQRSFGDREKGEGRKDCVGDRKSVV